MQTKLIAQSLDTERRAVAGGNHAKHVLDKAVLRKNCMVLITLSDAGSSAAHLRLAAGALDDDGVHDDIAACRAQAAHHQQTHRERSGVGQQRQAGPCERP